MRTAHQWIICLKPVRSEGWDCASNKCQSDSVHLHNSRQLGTNRLGPDKRRYRPCGLFQVSGYATYQDLAIKRDKVSLMQHSKRMALAIVSLFLISAFDVSACSLVPGYFYQITALKGRV